MHPQGQPRLYPAPTLKLPRASGAEVAALQRQQASAHLAFSGIELVDILRIDAKDSKESAPGFEIYG